MYSGIIVIVFILGKRYGGALEFISGLTPHSISVGCPWIKDGKITQSVYERRRFWCPRLFDGCPNRAFLSNQLYMCKCQTFIILRLNIFYFHHEEILFDLSLNCPLLTKCNIQYCPQALIIHKYV